MNLSIAASLLLSLLVATTIPLEQDVAHEEMKGNEIDPAYRENADDDPETKLLKERIRAVLEEIEPIANRVRSGEENVFVLFAAQRRLITAQLDFHKKPEKIISLLEKNVKIARAVETDRKKRADSGVGRPDDYAQAKYFRADAELQLLRAKKKYKVGSKK